MTNQSNFQLENAKSPSIFLIKSDIHMLFHQTLDVRDQKKTLLQKKYANNWNSGALSWPINI
jgi:hypothetical protein